MEKNNPSKFENVNIKDTIAAVNQMRADGVIGRYAIGGAVGATFYLEPVATFTMVAMIPTGAETITKRERGTLVFAWHDGSWKIVHEHFSSAE